MKSSLFILLSFITFHFSNVAAQNTGDEYFSLAADYKGKSQYDSALYFFEQAANQFAKSKNTVRELDALNQQGYILSILGSPDTAMLILDTALSRGLKIKKGENAQVAMSYHTKGVANYMMGNYKEALDYTLKGYEIRKRIYKNSHEEIALSLNNMGILYEYVDELDKAKEIYEEALAMNVELHGNKHVEVANSINNLGVNAYYRGNYEESIELYDSALHMFISLLGEKHKDVASQYINIGTIYVETGEFQKALDNTLKAKYIYEELYGKNDITYLNVALNLSNIYKQLRDLQTALNYGLEGYKLAEYFYGEQHPELAKLAQNIGVIYDDLDKMDEAISWQQKSLTINKNVVGEQNLSVAYNYNNIGTAYQKLKKYDEAESNLLKSIEIKEKLLGEKHVSLASSYYNLGVIYQAKNQQLKALKYSHKALMTNHFSFNDTSFYSIPPLQDYSNTYTFIQSLIMKAQAMCLLYFEDNDKRWIESAKKHIEASKSLIQQMQKSLSKEDKIYLADELYAMAQTGIYLANLEYHIDKNKLHLERAFEFVERSKAAILNSTIEESNAKKFAGISDELLNEEQQLNSDISYYNQEIALALNSGATESDIGPVRNQLFELKSSYSQLISKIEEEYPKYYELKYDVKTASLKDVQEQYLKKKPTTAIVEYLQIDSVFFAFVITENDFEFFEFSSPEADRNVRGLRNAIIFRIDDKISEISYELYNFLFRPIDAYLESKRNIEELVIISDGILGYLPFELMTTEIPKKSKFKKVQFLIDKYAIKYAISSTIMLKQFNAVSNAAEKDYIAFAPVFSDGSETNFLVNTTERFYNPNFQNTRGILRDGKISAIPATKDEVEEIDRMYKNKNLFAKYFLFKDAREENVKSSEIGTYKYVHMATHGFVNDKEPELSGLVLSQNVDGEEDGILFMGEIYNLDWNAELVALSACETGLGKVVRGEGILGLTRAFMYAGAKNVLVSLWKVSDASTSELMIEFYNHLLQGESKSESLRKAKQKLISNEKYSNPYYWAPFILIGN